jgi:hypothetical protein
METIITTALGLPRDMGKETIKKKRKSLISVEILIRVTATIITTALGLLRATGKETIKKKRKSLISVEIPIGLLRTMGKEKMKIYRVGQKMDLF